MARARVQHRWIWLWPLLTLVLGLVLVTAARERYEHWISVDRADVPELAAAQGREGFVICGTEYQFGGPAPLAVNACRAAIAREVPLTRTLFWAGAAIAVLSLGLLVRYWGWRRSALGLAVIGAATSALLFRWLLGLPLDNGRCLSLEGSEGVPSGCGAVRGIATGAMYLLVLAFLGCVGIAVWVLLCRRRWLTGRPAADEASLA